MKNILLKNNNRVSEYRFFFFPPERMESVLQSRPEKKAHTVHAVGTGTFSVTRNVFRSVEGGGGRSGQSVVRSIFVYELTPTYSVRRPTGTSYIITRVRDKNGKRFDFARSLSMFCRRVRADRRVD